MTGISKMPERITYLNGDKKEFQKLIHKCIQSGSATLVLTESMAQSIELSGELWSAHMFLPHALPNEQFTDKQLILIHHEYKSGHQIIVHYQSESPVPDSEPASKVIYWNCPPGQPTDTTYSFDKGRWSKL